MNKVYKIGASALCGTLAAFSASAGEMVVTGGATATWTQLGGANASTGNPLGMATGLTFKGSGELDGGQAFSVTVAHDDQNGFSAGTISLTTNSLGTLSLDQAAGGQGVGGYDDNVPTVWEETSGAGAKHGADQTKGVGSSTNIQWASPKFAGSTIKVAYAPKNSGQKINDKSVGGAAAEAKGAGWDVVLDINPEIGAGTFNLFAGYSNTELTSSTGASTEDRSSDHEEGTAGVIIGVGPVKAGFQRTFEHPANYTAGDTEYYANTMWGVSFNVNDNLSLSYGDYKSKKGFISRETNLTRELTATSWQIAYTMGGASLKFADTDVKNAQYVTGSAGDASARTIALTLAF